MQVFFLVIECVLLFIILYQDLKYRAVTWYLFPLLFGLFILNIDKLECQFLTFLIFNIGFVLIQLLFVSIYFAVKNKGWINITKGYLGWGDILFLLVVCLVFSPMNFIAYYLGSLVLTVLIVLILKIMDKKIQQIPLAGIQSCLLVLILIITYFFQINLLSDHALISLLII